MSGTRVGVAIVARRADGRVLVGRRLAEDGLPLALPGGKLDPGETLEDCALRELLEETGLILRFPEAFTAVFVDGWLVAGVSGVVEEGEPEVTEPDKFGDFSWIDPGFPPSGLYPATAAVLERLA